MSERTNTLLESAGRGVWGAVSPLFIKKFFDKVCLTKGELIFYRCSPLKVPFLKGLTLFKQEFSKVSPILSNYPKENPIK